MRVLLAVLLLWAAGEARAQTWGVMSIRSHHFQQNGQEERNYGLGLEHRLSPSWAVSGGAYRNSSGDGSVYAAGAYSVLQAGPARLSLLGGIVTGYETSPLPLGGLVASLEGRRLGVNLVLVPAAGGVALLMLKVRLD